MTTESMTSGAAPSRDLPARLREIAALQADHERRLASVEANVANHEQAIGRLGGYDDAEPPLDAALLADALASELHIDERHGFPPGFTVQELAVYVAKEYARLSATAPTADALDAAWRAVEEAGASRNATITFRYQPGFGFRAEAVWWVRKLQYTTAAVDGSGAAALQSLAARLRAGADGAEGEPK